MRSWVVLLILLASLLGGCQALTGDISHWPSSLAAVFVLIPAKWANDRYQVLAWPMEFLLASGVTMIVFSMIRLYFTELPY